MSNQQVDVIRLSVVMPVYNEVKTVHDIISQVLALPIDLELIVVDDGSTDGTTAVVQKLDKGLDPRLKTIYNDRNAGKGAAIRQALKHARGSVVTIQDADDEYDPRDILQMLAAIEDGASVVYGTRLSKQARAETCEGELGAFYLARRILTRLTNLIYRLRLTDEATCYKMFRRSLINSIPLQCNRFDFCPEITAKIAKRGYRIYEVPIHYNARSRKQGKKVGWVDAVYALIALIRFRIS